MKLFDPLAAALLTPSDIGLPEAKGGLDGAVGTVLGIAFIVITTASVIGLVAGGLKYTLSGGDSSGVKNAKETITYSLVGLIVALLAFGVVNFITSGVGGL